MLSKVSFVSKIADIMKATADDDKPIPGYLYKEVCQITLSSVENCETCLDFMVERLDHDSTHVKLKVLKLMKYIVENGHPNFRLGLMKKSTGIKHATKHSGPPDPLHGDVPYKMVRKNAQGLLESLFNMDITSTVPTANSQPHNAISTMGIGPAPVQHGSYGGKMEGFGNTPSSQYNMSLGENIKSSLFKMAEKLGETSETQQRALLSEIEGATSYTPPRVVHSHQTPDPVPSIQTVLKQKQVSPTKHIPGKAGGGWDDSDDDDDDDVIEDVTSDTERSRSAVSGSAAFDQRLDNETTIDVTAEQTVVSSHVENMDHKDAVLLKRPQLKQFLKECSGLNCDKIVELLNANISTATLEDGAVLRSLMLLEVLMLSDLVQLDRLTSVCRDGLVTVVNTRTGQSKSKARKLVRILQKLTSHQNILPLPRDTITSDS